MKVKSRSKNKDLALLEELLAVTQLKVKENQQQRIIAETNCEELIIEIQSLTNKVKDSITTLLHACVKEIQHSKLYYSFKLCLKSLLK